MIRHLDLDPRSNPDDVLGIFKPKGKDGKKR